MCIEIYNGPKKGKIVRLKYVNDGLSDNNAKINFLQLFFTWEATFFRGENDFIVLKAISVSIDSPKWHFLPALKKHHDVLKIRISTYQRV